MSGEYASFIGLHPTEGIQTVIFVDENFCDPYGSPTCQSILSPIKYKHEKLQFQNFSKLFQNSRTLYI